MNESTTTRRSRPPATVPGGPEIPGDLGIADWLDPGVIDIGACPALTTARTVREAAGEVREMLSRLADSDDLLPTVFVGEDGEFYTVEVDVVIRCAEAQETRDAVASEMEDFRYLQVPETKPALGACEYEARADDFAERAATLSSYLAAVGR